MKDCTIEKLAYRLKQAKEQNLPQPIVFLGAGASKTGEIPLAGEIITDILEHFKENPDIKDLQDENKTYPKLMDLLTPFERNKLLKGYIDRAKINVTHIYLAQLMEKGYVDYVLTVNFDNLMLRALALYNIFPPTYDMAILKDLTTTNFKEKSVLYLHGQHHGLWLLNTPEEMDKVREYIPPILKSIANERPWIFVGYSGEDPIFNHIVNLGRFDNGLYWVCYKDNIPGERVCTHLLDKPLTNAFIIKGYDADSLMLKLNQELDLPQPLIIDKPFTSLKNSLENIVDIDEEEHFKDVKERLEIVKNQVNTAINQFEKGVIQTERNLKKKADINRLKKAIIDKRVKGEYDETEIASIEKRISELNNTELNEQLANLYSDWGRTIRAEARRRKDEALYWQSFEKYEKATSLNPKHDTAFYNWGNAIAGLASLKSDETLYKQSFEKYEKAASLNQTDIDTFDNWGIAILKLARLKKDSALYRASIEKFKKAIELGGGSYNVSCVYALTKNKKNALKYLETSLKNNQVNIQYVETDEDWKEFLDDEDFKDLLNRFRNKESIS
jgi:tetratricopeptide (TPR) repeat protein